MQRSRSHMACCTLGPPINGVITRRITLFRRSLGPLSVQVLYKSLHAIPLCVAWMINIAAHIHKPHEWNCCSRATTSKPVVNWHDHPSRQPQELQLLHQAATFQQAASAERCTAGAGGAITCGCLPLRLPAAAGCLVCRGLHPLSLL
jgi:hypothetical protein